MAVSEKKFNEYVNPGALLDTDIFPFARSPFGSGTSFQTSMADVATYIGSTLIAVGNGQIAVGAADGTINGFAALIYDAGNQLLIAEKIRINGFVPTAGVVHNDTSGNLLSSLIVNADIDSAAAIAPSKLGAFSGGALVLTTNSVSKKIQESTVTSTELGYLSGVTSAIQTQLDQKQIGLNIQAVGTVPNVAGMTLSGPNFNLEAASASFPGVVTTGTQTFAGNKTFSGTISASNLSNTNTGDVSLNNVGTSPNSAGMSLSAQALTLQPADATNPGVVSTANQTFAGVKTFSGIIVTQISSPGFTALNVLAADASKNITSTSITSTALATLSQTANQVLLGNGASGITSSSALVVTSGTVLNTLGGCAFRGTGLNSFIGIGNSSSGSNGIICAGGDTGGAYFGNTNAGDGVLRNSSTSTTWRIGVGVSSAQLSVGNTLISTLSTVSVAIGATSANASCILDVVSSTKAIGNASGTTTQKNAISSPRGGAQFFDTTLSKLCIYSGTAWETITSI